MIDFRPNYKRLLAFLIMDSILSIPRFQHIGNTRKGEGHTDPVVYRNNTKTGIFKFPQGSTIAVGLISKYSNLSFPGEKRNKDIGPYEPCKKMLEGCK